MSHYCKIENETSFKIADLSKSPVSRCDWAPVPIYGYESGQWFVTDQGELCILGEDWHNGRAVLYRMDGACLSDREAYPVKVKIVVEEFEQG